MFSELHAFWWAANRDFIFMRIEICLVKSQQVETSEMSCTIIIIKVLSNCPWTNTCTDSAMPPILRLKRLAKKRWKRKVRKRSKNEQERARRERRRHMERFQNIREDDRQRRRGERKREELKMRQRWGLQLRKPLHLSVLCTFTVNGTIIADWFEISDNSICVFVTFPEILIRKWNNTVSKTNIFVSCFLVCCYKNKCLCQCPLVKLVSLCFWWVFLEKNKQTKKNNKTF